MSTTEPPLSPLPKGYPPVWNLPTNKPYEGYPPEEAQIHKQWDRLTLAIGHRLPVALNKMRFYRARLDDAVRY